MKGSGYTISISVSEPQVIDMQKVYYIQGCENPKFKRKRSRSVPFHNNFNNQEKKVDDLLTNSIQGGKDFETIWNLVQTNKDDNENKSEDKSIGNIISN